MRFLFTSDIHASYDHLFSMLRKAEKKSADAVVIGGDIIPHYLPDFDGYDILNAQAAYLEKTFIPALKQFKEQNRTKFYLDMGNDDFIAGRKLLENYQGELFELLHMQIHPFTDRVDLVGYMAVPPTPFGRKDWEKPDCKRQIYAPGNLISAEGVLSGKGFLEKTVIDLTSENSIETDLNSLEKKIRRPFIFVSHTPPYNTSLDVMYAGDHVGSLAVRDFIEKWSQKKYLIGSFHGHIHESPHRTGSIMTVIHNTPCFNPGQENGLGSRFRYMLLSLTDEKLKRHRLFFW
ncbi:MAG: metallophosphoesterase [Desulfobacterales bacterium]